MEVKTTPAINKDRLNRAIRCLQLLQRTNAPASSIAKSAGRALVPLLKEMAALPDDDLLAGEPGGPPHADARVRQAMGDATGADAEPS